MHPETVRRQEAERLRLEIARRTAAGQSGPDGPGEGSAPGAARRLDRQLVGLLDNVRSLWNVGSIFRSADGAGFGRLYLTGITGRPPRPEIAKTALGAEEVVAWEYQPDPLVAATRLRQAGFRLLALETGPGSVSWHQVDPHGPLCLMVGHEVAGLSPALCELADQRASLPMRGVKESLNVAVAFGIAAYGLAAARETRARASGVSAGESGTTPDRQGKS
jgi:tRNA G18 (ribose-2'-O)-methylase SpoU